MGVEYSTLALRLVRYISSSYIIDQLSFTIVARTVAVVWFSEPCALLCISRTASGLYYKSRVVFIRTAYATLFEFGDSEVDGRRRAVPLCCCGDPTSSAGSSPSLVDKYIRLSYTTARLEHVSFPLAASVAGSCCSSCSGSSQLSSRSGQVRYITRRKSRTMRVTGTRQLMLPPSTGTVT